MTLTQRVYICSQCGAETEWGDSLGDKPLCVNCWDAVQENTCQRAYRKRNRDKVLAYQRAYRERKKSQESA